MIDLEKLQATLTDQKQKERQAILDKQAKDKLIREQRERNFIDGINRHARELQGEIEKAIAKGEHSIWVLTDDSIWAVLDHFKLERHPGENPFYERFVTPHTYGSTKYDNPFHAMWEPLYRLGMRWEIDHTPESRDIDYRHDAYDILRLRWGHRE